MVATMKNKLGPAMLEHPGPWPQPDLEVETMSQRTPSAPPVNNPVTIPSPPITEPCTNINDLSIRYMQDFRETMPESTEVDNIQHAMRELHQLFGQMDPASFGPLALRQVRQAMIEANLTRRVVNARIDRIKRMFRWAVSFELVQPSVWHGLTSLRGLRRGQHGVREAPGIKPVPLEAVEATLPHLGEFLRAMVQVQLLTACRAGEVIVMRTCDIDFSTDPWVFRPEKHKGQWRGLSREILIGRKAQEILQPFLRHDEPEAYVFPAHRGRPPRVELLHRLRQQWKPDDYLTPAHAAELVGTSRPYVFKLCYAKRKIRVQKKGYWTRVNLYDLIDCMSRNQRPPGEKYKRRSYTHGIATACKRAGVPRWSPLQLRHAAATLIRAKYGIEAAQIVLGHARADVTQIYAERDTSKARQIIAEIG